MAYSSIPLVSYSSCASISPSSSSSSASSPASLPSWCSVVQVMEVNADARNHKKKQSDSLSSFASLTRYPNLRRVHAEGVVFTQLPVLAKSNVRKRNSTKSSPSAPPPSLSSLSHMHQSPASRSTRAGS